MFMGRKAGEILQVADTVARDKGINREDVFVAMEMAIQKAGRSKYGAEHDIRAEIDRKTGNIVLRRYRLVTDTIEDGVQQLTVKEAQAYKPGAVEGEYLIDELPPLDFGRIAAQTAKQVILQKVREAERDRQFAEFKDRVGELVNGVVKRIEFGNLTVDVGGRAEAILRRDELIQREVFKQGDRIRAYIYDVRPEGRGPQIFLSRTHPGFLAKLFMQEVPEIYDGIIQIKAVARDPGSRAKMAVYTRESNIDPVGSCVGLRGSRVQAVVNELQGEKIDIIRWTDDVASLVVSALTPSDVLKVVVDEDRHRIEAIVPDENLSLAIGRRGQNVRLASQLVGWDIDIMTESQESERRAEEFKQRSSLFKTALDVDDVIAHLLVAEGFGTIEDVAYIPLEELMEIEGFDEAVAQELINRAEGYLKAQEDAFIKQTKEQGIDEQLVSVAGLTPSMALIAAKNGIKTLDDLADLATDELMDIFQGEPITREDAEQIIMAARAHWFDDEDAEPEAEAADAAKASA
jgi:N utilization substance protein A